MDLIVEAEEQRQLFWQALAFEDGSLCTEVVSNTYLDRDDQWTPEQEHRLAALGLGPAEFAGPTELHSRRIEKRQTGT
jgi:hypothetical protein